MTNLISILKPLTYFEFENSVKRTKKGASPGENGITVEDLLLIIDITKQQKNNHSPNI